MMSLEGTKPATESCPWLMAWPDGGEVPANCLLVYRVSSDEVAVTSRKLGAQGLAILPDDDSPRWRAVWRWQVANLARRLAEALEVPRVGVFGVVLGVEGYYALSAVACERTDGGTQYLSADFLTGFLKGLNDPLYNTIPRS